MEIKLDLSKKEIEVIGTVNLGELMEKIMELNIDMSEWKLVTKTTYLGGLGLGQPIKSFPSDTGTPYPGTQVWYSSTNSI